MDRRNFLQLAGAGVALAACGGGGDASNPPSSHPGNVLMIAVDDLSDWVGFLAGHPQVRTPGMDALAARSHVFERAFCTAPLCSPARAGVLSGLSVAATGVSSNEQVFRGVNPGKAQIDDMFAAAGYVTRRIGKIDHNYTSEPLPLPAGIPLANKVCPAPIGEGAFDWGPAVGAEEDQPDYKYAQQGIDYLQAASTDQPFFLSVGFVRTHVGWYVPQRFLDMYPRSSVILPDVPANAIDGLGPVGKAIALKWGFHNCITSQGLWADAVAAYLASISWVDSQIARLVAALDASAHAANTTVVLWSDHGFLLGEHFHWHKLALWERATRVPFLVRKPGQSTSVSVDAPVSLRDLSPTLLALHGVSSPYAMEGRSLLPLMADPTLAWDYPVLTTKDLNDHAIRTRDWRCIRYASGERELYDKRADPGEYNNLAGDSRYASIISTLEASMPAVA